MIELNCSKSVINQLKTFFVWNCSMATEKDRKNTPKTISINFLVNSVGQSGYCIELANALQYMLHKSNGILTTKFKKPTVE